MKKRIILLLLVLGGLCACQAQGFVNLNFENASFVSDPNPQNSMYPYAVYASNAIPGWTAYVAGSPVADIFSNNAYLSGGCVAIIGTNNNLGFQPIQGKYCMLLAGDNYWIYTNTAGIGQIGQIPTNTVSLTFWGLLAGGNVSFNGQTLAVIQTDSTANYNIYAADISAYAGQTGQLLFTTSLGGISSIDNIQFSPSPVPEPHVFGLFALGSALIGLLRRDSRNRNFAGISSAPA